MPNAVSIVISGQDLASATIKGVEPAFVGLTGAAEATNGKLAQVQGALAAVEVQGAKLTTTLRQAGSATEIVKTLQDMASSGQAAAAQVAPLIEQLRRVEGEGAKANLSIRQVGEEIKGMSVSVRQATTETTPWVNAVNQLSGVIPGLSQAVRFYGLATLESSTGTQAVTTASSGATAAIGPLIAVVGGAAIAFGALTAGMHASVQVAGEYQASMLRVEALTGTTSAETAKFSDRIREIARDGPTSAKQLGDGLYYISSAGFKGAEAMQILEATSKTSAAGFGSFTNVADATTSILKAYHLSASEAARVTDILAATVIAGKIETDTFAQSIGLVLPVAAALHVPIEQVGAAIAVMTNNGLSSAEAVTALKNILGELLHPTQQGQQALESMGLTYKQLRDILADPSQGLPAVLQLLSTRVGENQEALGKVIPDIRGLVGILALGGENADEFNRVLAETANAQGRVAAAGETTAKAIEYQSKVMHNSMTEFGLAVGELAIPPVTQLIQHTTVLVRGVDSLASSVSGLKGSLAGLSNFQIDPKLEVILRMAAGTTPGGQLANLGNALWQATAPPGPPPIMDPRDAPAYNGPQTRYGTATGGGEAAPPLPELMSPDALRSSAEQMGAVTTEAGKMHATMVQMFQLPEDSNPEVLNRRLTELYGSAAKVEEQWRNTFDPRQPERASQRIAELQRLTDNYAEAVRSGSKDAQYAAQVDIDLFNARAHAADQDSAQAKRTAEFQHTQAAEARRAVAEAERIAREAKNADVGTGLAQSMAKGMESAELREGLSSTLAKTIESALAAAAARGSQQAAAAGKTLGDSIIAAAEEMRKHGAGDWQATLDQMFDVAQAIRRGEPGAMAALRELLVHAETEVQSSKAMEKWTDATRKAEEDQAKGFRTYTRAIEEADSKHHEAMVQAQETENRRIIDAQNQHTIDMTLAQERAAMDISRVVARQQQEDSDRAEQHRRSEADREQNAARALADIQARGAESTADAERRTKQQRTEAEIQHQERLTEIRRKGGPGMAEAVLDENRSYQHGLVRTQREEQSQAADRQAQLSRQLADARRRQAEQEADAARRTREQDADLGKSRERQATDRATQVSDAERLTNRRLELEQQYHLDAESKARQRFTDEMHRIDLASNHAKEAAQTKLDELEGGLRQKLFDLYNDLEQQFPWVAMGGLTMPVFARGAGADAASGPADYGEEYKASKPNPGDGGAPGKVTKDMLPHFAGGGSFTVPGQAVEGDNHLVQFVATPGERVQVGAAGGVPQQRAQTLEQNAGVVGGKGITINMAGMFSGATFVGGRESARQIVEWIVPELQKKLRGLMPAGSMPR